MKQKIQKNSMTKLPTHIWKIPTKTIKNPSVIQTDFPSISKDKQWMNYKDRTNLNGGLMETEVVQRNGIIFRKLQDSVIQTKNFITMQDILRFQVWIQMIKIQSHIKWVLTMLNLIDNNNGGLMETVVDLRSGITSKNLEDLVKMQMIFITKPDTQRFQVWIQTTKTQYPTKWE